ncbi:hypothetical protein CV102_24515 [Natronococcus pandeyae]|uniref:Uncharacterized protein n=1 Tax=Natronococcus pandeyae TaxID=2055836 RepID=A0A8J8PY97_9EURY|nr:hypothetical protein [Natronococcus pandeyae]TYL36016.1 hypothetical protein CV102_24515 [Natronococcus pandeyae]
MGENDTHSIDGVGRWGGGFTGGLAGGIAMGLVLHLGGNQIELLGGLAPIPAADIGAGWTIHLTLSVLFGLAFAAIISRRAVQEFVDTFREYVIAGIVFGTVLGIVAGGLIFPVAMTRAGVAGFPLPFLPVPGLAGELFAALLFAVGHLVYGLVLGAVFAAVNGAAPETIRSRVPTSE